MYEYCKAQKLVESFMKLDDQKIEVLYWPNEYTNINSLVLTIRRAIKRLKVDCTVSSRKGRIFLTKNIKVSREFYY